MMHQDVEKILSQELANCADPNSIWFERSYRLLKIYINIVNYVTQDKGYCNNHREYLNLSKMINFYKELKKNRESEYYLNNPFYVSLKEELKDYLQTLPKFSFERQEKGQEQDELTLESHGYLQMLLTGVLCEYNKEYFAKDYENQY
jgi:hypothetical protein